MLTSWELHSCKAFIDRIIDNTFDNKISLVSLPRHCPMGFQKALKKELKNMSFERIEVVNFKGLQNDEYLAYEKHIHGFFGLETSSEFTSYNISQILLYGGESSWYFTPEISQLS